MKRTTAQGANVMGLLMELGWDIWAGKVLTAPNDFYLQAEPDAKMAEDGFWNEAIATASRSGRSGRSLSSERSWRSSGGLYRSTYLGRCFLLSLTPTGSTSSSRKSWEIGR